MPNTHSLMIQGTTSDAGKSTLAAALCRILYRRSISVAPFKSQNMALNSAVSEDGGEIGRAQAVQAFACGLAPHTDMNPILLKPSSDKTAQVIIHGKASGNQDAKNYHDYKKVAMNAALASFDRLADQFEVIILEGAGSPAEINLRDNDIANMGFAEEIDCPVLLIADIDRGGVFAHLIGTLSLLSESEQNRVKGFVINRFRGDISLLQNGLDWLEEKTGKPVLGVIPYIHDLYIEAEDSLSNKNISSSKPPGYKIIAPALPRISNHTDFDPLRLHPDIHFQFIATGESIPSADLIILPGSKSVIDDLIWLKDNGWQESIFKHLRYGGKLIGICGGFQMMGNSILDPHNIEGKKAEYKGLGLLNFETTLNKNKILRKLEGRLTLDDSPVEGYEIHAGTSVGPAMGNPIVVCEELVDGAKSDDDQLMGSYLHGLFDNPAACSSLLNWAGLKTKESIDINLIREREMERLAEIVENNLDMRKVMDILEITEADNL